MHASKLSTVQDLRRGNRAEVLLRLYADGPLARPELARLTGLSQATVSNVVGDLLDAGIVTEAGAVDSSGGRPRMLLRIDPGYATVIGVDVGETRVKVELFDLGMRELARADYALTDQGTDVDQVVAAILAGLEKVSGHAGVDPARIMGVGIGVPGLVEHGDELLVHGQTMGWRAVPLVRLLQEGGAVPPLMVDNGAKTMGQAEMWFGAGRGADHAVMILLGSGIGASIVTDGKPYRGSTTSAGEIGHLTVAIDGRRCRCGAIGCLEAYVGAEAVLDRYREQRPDDTLTGADEETRIAALVAAADLDAVAAEVLDTTARYLGAGIGNLVNLLNPRRIVLGGWAGLAMGNRMLPAIQTYAAAHSLHRPFEGTSIELARLGADAVALGAATLPVEHFLRSGGRTD
ncbi:ROK family transcriptional regulator [Yinghuangia soli]|uniref:ROK family transcriptional regulator n=1 Tax=Yinghuangia soli TaxID=2908204 RepID=A0AA41TWF0_9ACTN|nr:ROK family transcriptional regulator [Yinghuangia soli]MCF2525778.1 ROK family transcriptional regulator [Yinghuangia soli]